MLYSAPGNVRPGSVTVILGAQGPVPNTIRGEFRDGRANYRLQVVEGTAENIGSEPVREATVAMKTITRRSQVDRAMAYALNKIRRVVRRYTWQCPVGALVSEPFDVVRLAYDTPALSPRRLGLPARRARP